MQLRQLSSLRAGKGVAAVTLLLGAALLSAALLGAASAAWAQAQAPTHQQAATMVVVAGKDLEGAILKKLGLPNRQYCWDMCLAEQRCTGVRWGVVERDIAGLCMMLSGDLATKPLPDVKTDDGKKIQITSARKQ